MRDNGLTFNPRVQILTAGGWTEGKGWLKEKVPMETYSIGMGDLKNAPMLNMLVVDSQAWRSNSFRITGNGRPYRFRVAPNYEELRKSLEPSQPVWDLVLHSCSLGFYGEPLLGAKEVAEAYRAGRVRGVICTATIELDGIKFCRFLDEAKVPVVYIPYKYNTPGLKLVVPFKEEGK